MYFTIVEEDYSTTVLTHLWNAIWEFHEMLWLPSDVSYA
jgi:hypothetical protein